MILSPFLCYPLNNQIAVCNADCLRTGVFNRHGHAAATRHLDERSHENIEVIFDCRRGDNLTNNLTNQYFIFRISCNR
jgi:hypothetical protein